MNGIRKTIALAALAFLGFGVAGVGTPDAGAQGPNGTTLIVSKTAQGHLTRTFNWTIAKSAAPSIWNLFRGDSGTSQYTVSVTKDAGTDEVSVGGTITVENGGEVATEGLAVQDCIEYKTGTSQFQTLQCRPVDLGSQTVIPAHSTATYAYEVRFTPVSGVEYRNAAYVTITNHSGRLGEAFGPQYRVGFSVPATPDRLVNEAINVDDTNGQSWTFGASGSQTYGKTFTCDANTGQANNTATIRETGQSASASVAVNCFALGVQKDASTAFKRTYHWTIGESADQSALTLAIGQAFLVNYAVTVNGSFTDSDWAVQGNVRVSNPAPVDATITSLSDVLSPAIDLALDCGSVTFPHILPAGQTLSCSYRAPLPDASARTNTATASLQNFAYDTPGNGTPAGTTDFAGTAAVDFGRATVAEVDKAIDVTDALAGSLGAVTHGADTLPKVFRFSRNIGSYGTCGSYTIEDTASFRAGDTGATGSATWTIKVSLPCGTGCTLTIGYWKTHAGAGPQQDMVTSLLPIWLGSPGGARSLQVTTASQARDILSLSDAYGSPSNGITKLYAQLLGAKLSLARGADGSAIASAVASADAFLATRAWGDWRNLSNADKQQVLSSMSTLDGYNNGLTGPGHCSQ